MRDRLWLLGLLLCGCDDGGLGSLLGDGGGPPDAAQADAAPLDAGRIDQGALDAAVDRGPPIEPPGPADRPLFAFPIHADDRALLRETLILGVDHDPVSRDGVQCLAHDGRNFPFCYDDHDGTDYLLTGGFDAMDRGSARIVAAAGGVVTRIEDGHYDRCHGTIEGGIDCDGHPMAANLVVLTHANGFRTRYLHLMAGSLRVDEGDAVDCGTVLGLVGSSGRSAQPHLHFEVLDPAGALIDPYAGEFSQPESYWADPPTAARRLPGAACHPRWRAPAP